MNDTVGEPGGTTAATGSLGHRQEVGPVADGRLQGKVALVTGSSSGIGAATARLLASHGATVVVNSATSVDAGRALADELPGASYVQGDIADEDQATALVNSTVERHGQLDILVNNAGTTAVIPHSDLASATAEVWRRIFDVNVIGTWQVTVAAVAHLRKSGDGCVVNVSSLAGHRAVGSSIPYAASKAALSHMTILLANVLGPAVRVNAVAPGLVDTPWTADWDDIRAFVTAQAPLGRSGTAGDIAEVIMSLVTARYVTGEVVLVDGGLHLR
jgi:ketoreductase RED2